MFACLFIQVLIYLFIYLFTHFIVCEIYSSEIIKRAKEVYDILMCHVAMDDPCFRFRHT
jgi:hypothetical protein